MKITVFTTGDSCTELGTFKSAHITMFNKNELCFTFIEDDEQMAFIRCCINNFVLISVQGHNVTIIPEAGNYQRVRLRFDSK